MATDRPLEVTLGTLEALVACAESAAGFFRECSRRRWRDEFFFTMFADEMKRQAAHLRRMWVAVSCKPRAFIAGKGPGTGTVEATRRWIEEAKELVRRERVTHGVALATARDVAGALLLQRSYAVVEGPGTEFEDRQDEMAGQVKEFYWALSLLVGAKIAEPVPRLALWHSRLHGTATHADSARSPGAVS